jgi:TolB-like protein/DNA-binding winged helix-turn-helix (wHTH) protein/Tfp pilus assembly protein PilF
MPDPRNTPIVRFGVFEVNLQAGETRKHGIRIKLRGQPHQILVMLLQRPGAIVSREEMHKRLWPADTFVEFEHSLNSAVKKLRQALGDTADHPRYVETLPRAGYRFIAPVEFLHADTPALQPVAGEPPLPPAGTATPEPQPESGQAASPAKASVRIPARTGYGILAAVAVLTVAGSLYIGQSAGWHRGVASKRIVLAVLPFENLSVDAQQEYFSDGLTEEMIAQLGRLDPEQLGVIARTSVMHYKHSQEPLEQIGRELGVQYVLEGSVRRDADKVRISAQLIQMKDQTHVWARQYDRDLSKLLVLQAEIARDIAGGIQLTLGDNKGVAADRKPPAPPSSYEAYDAYLKGRYFWNKRTAEGFQQAAEYFQQAIAKDPNYARAYAGLADTWALMSTWTMVPASEFVPKARAAALKALQIDDGLAEAHTSLALIAEFFSYDWQTAEKEYRRAIELDPSYATAHQWYAECLSFEGRFDEALAESARARQLDPLSLIIATDHGAILYFSRQYDRAIEQLDAVLDMEPSFSRAHGLVIYASVEGGKFQDALAEIEKWRRLPGVADPGIWAWQAYIYSRWNRREQAQQLLKKFERDAPWDPSVMRLLVYLGMDRKEEAIALLQKGYAPNGVVALKVDPLYDPLRSDPRFQELLRRVGLAP